jgi:MerR family transcriptional regulator, thiopeptide resistance regulator
VADDRLWHIGDVARLSGVSPRTLRHYDAIGLLRPTHTDRDGTRYYDHDALLRLQRILLLRELDVGLSEIRRVVDGEADELAALSQHRAELADDLERRTRLLTTIDTTIAALTEGTTMTPDELFDGFDPRRQAQWEADLVDRLGEDAVTTIAESKRRMSTWTRSDADAAVTGFDDVDAALAGLLVAGVPADDPRTQQVIAQHYDLVSRFWTPDATSYAGLGDMYVDHPDFRARYENRQPGLSEYLREGMRRYASTHLD